MPRVTRPAARFIDEADGGPAARAQRRTVRCDLREGRIEPHRIDCDYVAGCDGYARHEPAIDPGHGGASFEKATRSAGSASCRRRRRIRTSSTAATRGFALASMRTRMLSRYYIQCDPTELTDWPDDRFWHEFKARCPRRWRTISSPARRSKSRSRRYAASSPNRCGTAACSSPAMPPISCRRPAPRY